MITVFPPVVLSFSFPSSLQIPDWGHARHPWSPGLGQERPLEEVWPPAHFSGSVPCGAVASLDNRVLLLHLLCWNGWPNLWGGYFKLRKWALVPSLGSRMGGHRRGGVFHATVPQPFLPCQALEPPW